MAEADGKPAVKMLQAEGEAYWHGVAHGKTYGERERLNSFLGSHFLVFTFVGRLGQSPREVLARSSAGVVAQR